MLKSKSAFSRFFGVVFALALAVSLLPVGVVATEADSGTEAESSAVMETIGRTVADALEAAETEARSEAALPEAADEEQPATDDLSQEETGDAPQSITPSSEYRPRAVEAFEFKINTVTPNSSSKYEYYLPTYGGVGAPFDWSVDWGDGNTTVVTGTTGTDVLHEYVSSGDYTIVITPNGSDQAWLAAFGYAEANNLTTLTAENRNRLSNIRSEFTPLMTRTQNQIDGIDPPPDYEWSNTFSYCKNLDNTGPGFANEWNAITEVGDFFAANMFEGCSNLSFTMEYDFNLPTGIISTGESFADSMFYEVSGNVFYMNPSFNIPQGIQSMGQNSLRMMFYGCKGTAFNMNGVFNLPQGITVPPLRFGANMFTECQGAAFNMNTVFNLPAAAVTVSGNFATGMFYSCTGASFTMNDVFNLPQGITQTGNFFASNLFYGCTGAAFNMNEVFNFPQSISSVGSNFALAMFRNCSGGSFQVNDVFRFARLTQTDLDKGSNYQQVFAGIAATTQKRSALSIVNMPGDGTANLSAPPLIPSTARNTFTGAFRDQPTLPANWGGGAQTVDALLTFDTNGVPNLAFPAQTAGVAQTKLSSKQTQTVGLPAVSYPGGYSDGWFTDRDCDPTTEWNFADPIDAATLTLYAYNPLTYTYDVSYDIPASQQGTSITSIDVASTASHGTAPYTFSATGLPAGLTVSTAGVISGTPTTYSAAGTAKVTVTDYNGLQKTITINYGVISPLALTFADSAAYDIPALTVGTAMSNIDVSAGASQGVGPYTFSSTDLPAGLSISSAGVISGTPTAPVVAGTATITVTDSWSATESITIDIGTISPASALSFTDSPAYDIPTGTVGSAISPIDVTGGVSGGVPPYSFSHSGLPSGVNISSEGTFSATGLPAGISISSAGVISGTPAAPIPAGTATLTVTDDWGDTDSIDIDYGVISPAAAPPTPQAPGTGGTPGTPGATNQTGQGASPTGDAQPLWLILGAVLGLIATCLILGVSTAWILRNRRRKGESHG